MGRALCVRLFGSLAVYRSCVMCHVSCVCTLWSVRAHTAGKLVELLCVYVVRDRVCVLAPRSECWGVARARGGAGGTDRGGGYLEV